nr:LAETG motif-containing sortase-dependent surface protein [Leucobacter sp. cx-169]
MITVDFANDAYNGTTVTGVLFSDPLDLGASAVAEAAAKFKIPANAPLGKHRVAVFDSIGLLIGWADIELVAAPVDTKPPATGTGNGSGLSSTGSDDAGLWVAGGAAALLLLGGGALLLARRRTVAE